MFYFIFLSFVISDRLDLKDVDLSKLNEEWEKEGPNRVFNIIASKLGDIFLHQKLYSFYTKFFTAKFSFYNKK